MNNLSRNVRILFPALVAGLMLAACASNPPADTVGVAPSIMTMQITGEMSYRERIAMPPNTVARAVVEDSSVEPAVIIASSDDVLEGEQVPVAFTLEVPQNKLLAGHEYRLEASLVGRQGQPMWSASQALNLAPGQANLDIGTLWLARVAAEPPPSYTARGQEPGWLLTINDAETTLEWNYGEDKLSTVTPVPRPSINGRRYTIDDGVRQVIVDITHGLCRDSMSGMPYPDEVMILMGDTTLKGCGGEPVSLLTGGEWRVEDINGGGVIDNSHATLVFNADGTAGGSASCNNWHGQFRITGEGFGFGGIATTLKACAPALEQQERRFLDVLNHATGFDIDPHGRLIIHAGPDKSLTAVR